MQEICGTGFRSAKLQHIDLHVRRRARDHHGGESLVFGVPLFYKIPVRIVNGIKMNKKLVDALGYGDEQRLHILGVLDEVILCHEVN